jgi:hypothetical protein
MTQYINYYEHCGSAWSMIWDCGCDDRCPDCGAEITPYSSVEVGGEKPEECFFCGSQNTVPFNEHYTFCKNCTAIYTEMIVVETNCDHIKENSVIVDREPWFKKIRNKCKKEGKAYILKDNRCSKCNAITIADGW